MMLMAVSAVVLIGIIAVLVRIIRHNGGNQNEPPAVPTSTLIIRMIVVKDSDG